MGPLGDDHFLSFCQGLCFLGRCSVLGSDLAILPTRWCPLIGRSVEIWENCPEMADLLPQVSQVYVRAYNKKAAAIEQAGHWRAWGVWMEDMDQRATKLLYMRYTEIFDNVMVYVMESWVYWTRILASTCLIMMWRHRDAISCNRLMLQWQKIQYSTT